MLLLERLIQLQVSMKKNLFFIFFLSAFLLTSSFAGELYAQTTQGSACSTVTSTNYPQCCPSNDPVIGRKCVDYKINLCAASPQAPICNPIRGGTQQTNPFSSTTYQADSGDGTTPQAGSVEILSCSNTKLRSLFDILIWIKCIIAVAVIPLIFSLAFLVFLWGVFKFMTASDVKGKQEGQKVIWWGMLGLFVMVSIWGILQILGTTLGIDATFVPQLQTK